MKLITFIIASFLTATAIAGSCDCCGNGPLPDGCPPNGSKKRDMGIAVTSFPRRWIESLTARDAEVVEIKV